jgi:hypothetical protein
MHVQPSQYFTNVESSLRQIWTENHQQPFLFCTNVGRGWIFVGTEYRPPLIGNPTIFRSQPADPFYGLALRVRYGTWPSQILWARSEPIDVGSIARQIWTTVSELRCELVFL